MRDPRVRSFGHIEPENMDPAKQTQDMLAVSASMRTALLVYSGITLKMMVDTDLGAQLSTMFMVQNDAGGGAGPHDHPFEETYLILEGEVDGVFDGTPTTSRSATSGGPAPAACTRSRTRDPGPSGGWRRRRPSRRPGIRTGSSGTGCTCARPSAEPTNGDR